LRWRGRRLEEGMRKKTRRNKMKRKIGRRMGNRIREYERED
jgi:hypothetical protein